MKRMQRFQNDFFFRIFVIVEKKKCKMNFLSSVFSVKISTFEQKICFCHRNEFRKIIISIIFILSIARTNQHETRRTLTGKSWKKLEKKFETDLPYFI
jgi:hypothetical protein